MNSLLVEREAILPARGHDSHDRSATPVGQLIGAFIADMARMAADPAPFHLMPRLRRIQRLPQIGILDRLLRCRLPAALLPAVYPFADALLHILAVGMQYDIAGPRQRAQCLDDRHQFHAVIRGIALAAANFLLMLAGFKPGAPAARAGIALAGAVSKNFNLVHTHSCD